MKKLITFLLLFSQQVFCQEFHINQIDTKKDASFRGVSVPNDRVAWVSGTNGWVGKTINGGKDWTFKQVMGYEQNDFRTIYAFNSQTAIIANAGSPAYILRTDDGGETWTQVYKKLDSAAFFDGMDFWNKKNGIIYGDPLHTRMLILKTYDGGFSWKAIADKCRPILADGEASFAASGTCINCIKKKKVIIATGGKVSRILESNDKAKTWHSYATPILQGESSRGIFSFTNRNKHKFIIVGGDYKTDTLSKNNVFISENEGATWKSPEKVTRGYRECIEYMGNDTYLAVGPSGIDISADGGKIWQPFSDDKYYHVVKRARKGKLTIIAGGKGKLGIIGQ